MFERFASSTRTAVEHGVEEAGRRGDRRIGTEHLLLGVLHDRETAEAVGLTADQVRAKADALDVKALEAIGLPIGDFRPAVRPRKLGRTPFTSGAKAVLQKTVSFTAAERSRRILPRHLLMALLERPQPDPAAALLAECDVDAAALTRRLSGPQR
jgi:ATP-dependent Clp protease ATP-binding subunit ClpA